MSNSNLPAHYRTTLIAALDPKLSGELQQTSWIAVQSFETLMVVICVGAMGSNAEVSAQLEQAKDDSGTDVKGIAGKVLGPLTDIVNDANQQYLIECRGDEFEVNEDFDYVRLSLEVTGGNAQICALLFGLDARYQPEALVDTVTVVTA